MKRSRQLALLAIAQTPFALVGCDVHDAPAEATRQGFYTSVEACERDGNSAELCTRASQAAAAAGQNGAPRFKTKAECIAEYGDLCAEREHDGGVWMPLMTGFMLSQLLAPGRPPVYLDASPIYRTRAGRYAEVFRDRDAGAAAGYYGRSGGWTSSGGAHVRAVDIAPNRAITIARSGFGSSAAARSGWGSRSFGG